MHGFALVIKVKKYQDIFIRMIQVMQVMQVMQIMQVIQVMIHYDYRSSVLFICSDFKDAHSIFNCCIWYCNIKPSVQVPLLEWQTSMNAK